MCQWHLERLRQSVGPRRVSASGDAGAGASSAACLRCMCCAGELLRAAPAQWPHRHVQRRRQRQPVRDVSISGFSVSGVPKCGHRNRKRPALGSHDEGRLRTNGHLRNTADGVKRSVSRFLPQKPSSVSGSKPRPSVSDFCRSLRTSTSDSEWG